MCIKLSNDYEVYCFDYYDTIVRRTVEPEYVKKIWCKEIKEFYNIELSTQDLYLLRNKSEALLCAENEKSGKDLEFRYCDLAEKIYSSVELPSNTSLTNFLEISEALELEIESRVQFLCDDTIAEIRRLKKLGKRIFCISDFYTSSEFLHKLLCYHGINELFDEVFVSSDILLTKRSGRLYDYVLNLINVEADYLCMVGDNRWSDYDMPIQKGMNAYWIDRKQCREEYEVFRREHENSSYIEQELGKLYKSCDRSQYEDLSYSLYCFTDKLYAYLRRNRIRDVFFLSREGEFLKKIFDTYQEKRTCNGVKPIRSHYLMVSRKATFIASLKPLMEETFEMIFRQYVNISLYDFLSSLGFEVNVQEELGRQLKVDIYEKQVDLPRTEIYAALKANSYFIEQYETLRIEQKNNFEEYLKSFGVNFEQEGMYLVDVGWKGTIQDNILMFFEENVKIVGLYLGLVAPGKIHVNNVKEGLLFTNLPYPQKNFYIYDENKSVFEVMLGASHGSADHYIKTKDEIVVATSEKQEERNLFQNVISPMQSKIYSHFEAIDEILINHSFEKTDLEKYVAKIHARLVFLPLKQQIELFYHIYHYENFGVFEFTKFKTKSHISVGDRIRSLKKMLTQRRSFFQSSFWGIIALKDAGLDALIKPYGWYKYDKCYRKENK